MNGFVANTDFDWFTFLKERQPLDEVNFWQPSGGDAFRALQPGEPFFFRLKKPYYAIAGFGFFARHEIVSAKLAWEAFTERNGAPTFAAMCARIEKYRPAQPPDPHKSYKIGCIMISQPAFFAQGDWVSEPQGFSRNIVRGARYDLETGEGRRIWDACLDRIRADPIRFAAEPLHDLGARLEGPRFGTPQLVQPRLGQGTFRIALTQAYHGACAVSGEHSLPVLDVAHIQRYADGGPHEMRNGLLLRTDIHRLFDGGYVTITPDYKFKVSRLLREQYENGKTYYALEGMSRLPKHPGERPDPDLLRWHNERVFEKGIAA